jgi:hypothetical protein
LRRELINNCFLVVEVSDTFVTKQVTAAAAALLLVCVQWVHAADLLGCSQQL